jgi:uncharacterized protein
LKAHNRGWLLRNFRSAILFFIGIGLYVAFVAPPSKALACPLELPSAQISIKGRALTVELAATPAARACGLSHRDHLPQNTGMLFIFPAPRPLTFWMKDTRIPLSIAFLDDSGEILEIQTMVPMQTEPLYHSPGPAKYALEVNQGWFERHGIAAGDRVVLELPLVIDIK